MAANKPTGTPDFNVHTVKRRRRKHSKRKHSIIVHSFKWIKAHPYKVIALLVAFILIYITFLFIKYANEHSAENNTSYKVISKHCRKV